MDTQPVEMDNAAKLREAVLVNQRLLKMKWTQNLYSFNTQCLMAEEGKGRVKLGAVHRQMCDFVDKNPDRQKILLIPRGHLKSSLITIGKSLQWIAENPSVRILIANATYSMATAFLTVIKRHLTNNAMYKEIFGNLAVDPEKWSENMITLNQAHVVGGEKEATVVCYGSGGNLVSQHYDKIILDDVVNEDTVATKEQIEKTIQFYRMCQPLLEKGGEMIIIGTRWREDDLYGWLMEKENGVVQDFDIFLRTAIQNDLWDERKKEFVQGTVLWPEKYNLKDLSEIKRKMGPYSFSSQYLNNPVPPNDADFKRVWFKYYETADIKGMDMNRYTFVDPAISMEAQADYSAIVTIGVDQYSNIYILDIERERMKPDELINAIFRTYERWHPMSIGVEQVGFQKTLRYSLKKEEEERKRFLNIIELKPDGRNKEQRIRGLQPQYANGKVLHNRDLMYNIYLEDELLRFPRGKHDDICLAGNTLIKTSRGDIKIKNVVEGDFVLTRDGYKKVLKSYMTGLKSTITRLGITATPDHPFITNDGVRRFDNIRPSDILYIWNEKLSSIEEKNITDILNQKEDNLESISGDTINGKNHHLRFIDRFGLTILGKYLLDSISIIKMKILSIMKYPILNSLVNQTTPAYIQVNHTEKKCPEETLKLHESSLVNGMGAKQEGNGMGYIQEKDGTISNLLKKNAFNVAKNTRLHSKIQNSVGNNTAESNTENYTKVYNLLIEDSHEFFANNVLVHNCDALAYALDFIHPPVKRVSSNRKHKYLYG